MERIKKYILTVIALLKRFRKTISIAVIAFVLGLAYIVNSFYTPPQNSIIALPSPKPADETITVPEKSTVETAPPTVIVAHPAPESLAATVAKASNPALPDGDNSLPLTVTTGSNRTPAAETPLAQTPIPSATALMGSGLVAVLALRKRRQNALA